jgi:hypothetical protein
LKFTTKVVIVEFLRSQVNQNFNIPLVSTKRTFEHADDGVFLRLVERYKGANPGGVPRAGSEADEHGIEIYH